MRLPRPAYIMVVVVWRGIHSKSDTNNILLLTQAAVLPGSDAGSNVVKPALSYLLIELGYPNIAVRLIGVCFILNCNTICIILNRQYNIILKKHKIRLLIKGQQPYIFIDILITFFLTHVLMYNALLLIYIFLDHRYELFNEYLLFYKRKKKC